MVWKLILLVLALFGLFAWLGGTWRKRFSFEPGYEEIHLAGTRDGWRIALYRYPAASRLYERPVLLCHGLGANRFNFDLGPEVSLARYLQREGFEVWSMELRGRGNSRWHGRGDGRLETPPVFDDYVREDARVAIGHVLEKTGASQLHWIGHSLGGLVLYGVLQGEHAGSIASGVTIASPGSFAHAGRPPGAHLLLKALSFLPRIHLSFLASGLAPLVARFPGGTLFVNRKNVEVRTLERALCHLASGVSGRELSQILDWTKSRQFRSFDKVHTYDRDFGSIHQPLLFLAGSRDLLVPPAAVAAAFDRVASPKKALVVFGREQGQQEEYGHGDLLIGKNVCQEVFPLIREWLVSVERA